MDNAAGYDPEAILAAGLSAFLLPLVASAERTSIIRRQIDKSATDVCGHELDQTPHGSSQVTLNP